MYLQIQLHVHAEYIVNQSNMEQEYAEYEECVKNMIDKVEKHVKSQQKTFFFSISNNKIVLIP